MEHYALCATSQHHHHHHDHLEDDHYCRHDDDDDEHLGMCWSDGQALLLAASATKISAPADCLLQSLHHDDGHDVFQFFYILLNIESKRIELKA